MANPGYVRSTDGDDADNGSTWALANATLVGAIADASAGDRIYVSDAHAESTAGSLALASPGTLDSPCEFICGDDAAEPPTATATSATVATTGFSNIVFTGSAIYRGITFTVASGSFGDININRSNLGFTVFEQCELALGSNNILDDIRIGGEGAQPQSSKVVFIDTDVRFGGTGQGIDIAGCTFEWRGGTVLGTMPSTLFTPYTNNQLAIDILLEGVDLSPLGSSSIIDIDNGPRVRAVFSRCKLGSGYVATVGTWGQRGGFVEFINCDSGDTNYKYYKGCYEGEVFDETTIVRTGGASDGTTPLSHRYVSSANTKFYVPLVGPWRGFWNETTGSAVTVAMECVWFGTALLKDDEAWIEVEYLGTSGFPISSFASDRAADILTAGANQTASTEPWVGTDRANSNLYSLNDIIEVQGRLWICTTAGSSDSSEPAGYASGSDGSSVNDGGAVFRAGYRLTLSKQVTPQEKGVIRARVCLAKASTTLYACPKLEVS